MTFFPTNKANRAALHRTELNDADGVCRMPANKPRLLEKFSTVMSKSKIFKEEFFNSETNEKFNKIHLQLDPTHEDLSPFLRFLNSLADFQSKWVEKEGGIPEELDKRCINMLGLRFALIVPTLFEVHMRLQLFTRWCY